MSDSGAVFLDRDGTLIVEKEYLSDPDEVELERGVIEGLMLLQSVGRPLVVVTNQSGIGRGYFGLDAAVAVNERIDAILREHGIVLSAWYLCPHAPEEGCRCRKPGRALADRAAADLGIRLEELLRDRRQALRRGTRVRDRCDRDPDLDRSRVVGCGVGNRQELSCNR